MINHSPTVPRWVANAANTGRRSHGAVLRLHPVLLSNRLVGCSGYPPGLRDEPSSFCRAPLRIYGIETIRFPATRELPGVLRHSRCREGPTILTARSAFLARIRRGLQPVDPLLAAVRAAEGPARPVDARHGRERAEDPDERFVTLDAMPAGDPVDYHRFPFETVNHHRARNRTTTPGRPIPRSGRLVGRSLSSPSTSLSATSRRRTSNAPSCSAPVMRSPCLPA